MEFTSPPMPPLVIINNQIKYLIDYTKPFITLLHKRFENVASKFLGSFQVNTLLD